MQSIKYVILFSMLLFVASCSNPEAQAQIESLTAENSRLKVEIDSLQKSLDIIKAKADSVHNALSKLDMK